MTSRWKREDDLALREGVLAGDRDIASRFFERHVDALYEFVHYRLGDDRGAVEDVVQDTFLVALDRMPSFDGRSALHTWLCGIAKNKIRALRRKRRPASMSDLLAEADAEIDDILVGLEVEPLPEWILERSETRELVGATLSSLSPGHRSALVEKYLEGRSVAEMAERAGKGVKATESRLHRARLAFSRVFQLLARRRGGLT